MNKIVLFCFIFLNVTISFALDIKDETKEYLSFYTAPLKWKEKDFARFSLFLTTVTLSFMLDEDIKEYVQKNKTNFTNKFSANVRSLGSPIYDTSALSFLYLFSRLKEDKKLSDSTIIAFKSMLAANSLVLGLKLFTHRERPYTENRKKWNGASLSLNDDNLSFPSGHTATAFSIATVFAKRYNGIVAPISYFLATSVAFSRINDNKHYFSDTIASALIGYYSALFFLNKKQNFTIIIEKTKKRKGVLFSWKF